MQRPDALAESLHIHPPDEDRLLFSQIFPQRVRQIEEGLGVPLNQAGARLGDTMGGNISYEPAQILFRIPAEIFPDMENLRGKYAVSRNPDFAICGFIVKEQSGQQGGHDRKARILFRAACNCRDLATRLHRQGEVADVRNADTQGFAHGGLKPPKRPARSAYQVIEGRYRG